ncbi:MAG: cyclase [Ruminococcaceae bacterium]|nr:cyclase [Oscillospiraceae bacterium]
MTIYDISQEVFSSRIYPGDPSPRREVLSATSRGDAYNLTAFSMCAHNGTHIDAPFHFLPNGSTVDKIPLSKTVGPAYVAACEGILDAAAARALLAEAQSASSEAAKRLLIRGNAVLTLDAAQVLAAAGLDLIGTESQSVGPQEAPMAVHLALLSAEIVLLEGIRLHDVPTGTYFLSAAPLSLGGADGAPCRALLISW